MLVFGDREREVATGVAIAELGDLVDGARSTRGDHERHAMLVAAFVEAGMLAQGLADAELDERDARTPLGDAAMRVTLALADAVARSWDGTGSEQDTDAIAAALRSLGALRLPDRVRLRVPEGYAHYALYPETYLVAARRAVRDDPRPRQVVGIRSIGTGLAAMVAVGADAALPATVRPRGHPYDRQLAIAPTLHAAWDAPDTVVAIVDEGPGRSGSSFDCVIAAVGDLGRVECYPSHRGELGPEAPMERRERWARVRRHVADFDEVVRPRLLAWLPQLVGPLVAPLADVSGGSWRSLRFASERDYPPVIAFQERRKFLARTGDGAWLVRFAGLGREGMDVTRRARALHAAGFTPEVAGACHGFLVERWVEPADASRSPDPETVARYLRFLARERRAAPSRGASVEELVAMVRRNAVLALGEAVAPAVERFATRLRRLAPRLAPCEIDGRLHRWEWITTHSGRVYKADAHDHHRAHDLVGCQDIAWDVAGAAIELGLALDRTFDHELAAALRIPYLAFQLGRHTLARDCVDAREAARLEIEISRYRDLLWSDLCEGIESQPRSI